MKTTHSPQRITIAFLPASTAASVTLSGYALWVAVHLSQIVACSIPAVTVHRGQESVVEGAAVAVEAEVGVAFEVARKEYVVLEG